MPFKRGSQRFVPSKDQEIFVDLCLPGQATIS